MSLLAPYIAEIKTNTIISALYWKYMLAYGPGVASRFCANIGSAISSIGSANRERNAIGANSRMRYAIFCMLNAYAKVCSGLKIIELIISPGEFPNAEKTPLMLLPR